MKKNICYFLGIISYVLATILIINYLFLEFSIFDVASPIERIKIVISAVGLMYIGCFFFNRTNNLICNKLPKINLIIWFVLYLIMILNLTLFDKYFGRNYLVNTFNNILDFEQMKIRFQITANTVPFKTINNFYYAFQKGNMGIGYFLQNIVGNLVAFMPLSFFVPRLFKSINKWYKFFIVSSLFIIGIEFCQFLLNSGSFDIDDYMLNVCGTMVLYILINNKLIKRFVNRIFGLEKDGVVC